MSLPDLMTEDGLTRSLLMARQGLGRSLGYAYQKYLINKGWADKDLYLTDAGAAEIQRRAPA